jgi:hypothetical protein
MITVYNAYYALDASTIESITLGYHSRAQPTGCNRVSYSVQKLLIYKACDLNAFSFQRQTV